MAGTNENKRRRVLVEAQGHRLKVQIKCPGGVAPGGCKGVVSTFSKASRKAMIDTLSRIDVALAGFICFITLTYPDRDGPSTPEQAERDRQTFFKRLKRAFPESSAIWRREWKARLSGAFVGAEFPHYHLLCFNLPFLEYERLNQIWREVIGYPEYVRTEIKAAQSWRHALYYVSKYMAKVPEPTPFVPALAEASGGEAAGSLVYASYLTAPDLPKAKSKGRAWGVFNRKKCPFGEKKSLRLPPGDWLKQAKQRAREIWSGVNEDPIAALRCFWTIRTNSCTNSVPWGKTVHTSSTRTASMIRSRSDLAPGCGGKPRRDVLPAWITEELIAETIETWQPYYTEVLTRYAALEILRGVALLAEALEKPRP